MRTLAGPLCAGATWIARGSRTAAICGGLGLGIAVWSAAHPFVATFGFNRETIAALLIATVGTFVSGLSFARRNRGAGSYGAPLLLAAGWLIFLPAILSAAESIVAFVPVETLALGACRLPVLALAALCVIGLPSLCAGIAVASQLQRGGDGATLLLSSAAGVTLNAFLLAPSVGLQLPLLCVAVCAAAAWFIGIVRGTAAPTEEARSQIVPAADSRAIVSIACAALLCGVCGRAAAQLMPEASYLIATGVAGILAGLGLGARLARQMGGRYGDDSCRRIGAAVVASASLLPLAAFPWLVERHLDANAYVASVLWLMVIRAGTIAAFVLPIGVGCGLITAPAGSPVSAVVCALALGLTASGWLIPLAGIIPLAVTAALCLILLNAGPARSVISRSRRSWMSAAACAAGLVGLGLGAGRYEPAKSARLLFSTEAFIAHQRGVPTELLPHLDDTRLVTTVERPGGTATIWKQRGDAFSIRVNGIPVAATSTRPDRSPLPSADVLRMALPLILHAAPESVLILGDPAGLALATAAAFPVREIACYDPADGVREASAGLVPTAVDDRVTRAAVEPRLALSAEDRVFDVVASDPGASFLPAASACFTREFYARAAARLTDDGIFCQRLRYADFGPMPLRIIAATTRGLFGDTMIVEVGPGEYVLLATPHGATLVRPDLVDRLQRPHVRRTLATLGWDWCVPLNLAVVADDGMDKLAEAAQATNTASNGLLTHVLPPEVMRWGPKSQELQQATADLTTRLIATAVPESDRRDVLDRVAEVTGQHRLMTEYPDQPWAYRKEIRSKLKEAPRSVIQPVAGTVERVMHPDDRRRLEYFAALGDAAKKPSQESLDRFERFAEPYDPLLSYFLHHEAAALYTKLGPVGNAGELEHRLYAAHFGDLHDRSVRNEIAALELIVENPALISERSDRFDQLNSLLEVLLSRWEARGTAQPKSPEVVLVDIDKTLDAVGAAVEAMEPLATAAGLSDEQWRLRRAAVERTLTRPLRSYRTGLLPHVRAAQRKETAKTMTR